MTRSHPPFQYMKQFKAVAMDFEYYSSLEDIRRLYCLTDRQIYILLVQLEYVAWMTRWYNTDDTNATQLKLIQSDLMEALMSCVDISILVDQGKLTLTRSVQQQQIQSQQLRDDYAEEYDGNPTSINPDAPTTNFGSTGDRYDALCAALMAFVYQFAKAQIEAIIAGDAAAFALLAGAAILLIPGLNLFFIAGAAIALIAGGGIIGVTTATAVAALSDTTALDAVVCYMRDQLKDLGVSEANFAACLDSYPFSVGSHEAIICDFLKPTLASNYLPVLDMLGQAYSGTIAGEPLPECPCGEWCRSITGSDLQSMFEPTGGLGPQAEWTGTGYGANDALIPARITLEGDLGATHALTSVRVIFSGTNAVGDVNTVTAYTEDFVSVLDDAPFTDSVLLLFTASLRIFEIDVVSSFAPTTVPITVQIDEIRVTGTGTEPSFGTAC